MKKRNTNWINDETEMPSLTPNFFKNAKKAIEERDAVSSSAEKSPKMYADSIMDDLQEKFPHHTREELEKEIDAFW